MESYDQARAAEARADQAERAWQEAEHPFDASEHRAAVSRAAAAEARAAELEAALREAVRVLTGHDCAKDYADEGEPYVCDECDALDAVRHALARGDASEPGLVMQPANSAVRESEGATGSGGPGSLTSPDDAVGRGQ